MKITDLHGQRLVINILDQMVVAGVVPVFVEKRNFKLSLLRWITCFQKRTNRFTHAARRYVILLSRRVMKIRRLGRDECNNSKLCFVLRLHGNAVRALLCKNQDGNAQMLSEEKLYVVVASSGRNSVFDNYSRRRRQG